MQCAVLIRLRHATLVVQHLVCDVRTTLPYIRAIIYVRLPDGSILRSDMFPLGMKDVEGSWQGALAR